MQIALKRPWGCDAFFLLPPLRKRLKGWRPALRKKCAELLFLSLAAVGGLGHAQEQRPTRNGMDLSSEWKLMMEELREAAPAEQLVKVNTFFNRRISYERGVSTRLPDQGWQTTGAILRAGMGDCKEFAMAKYFTLQMLGIPSDHLRLMYVQAQVGGELLPHLVLGYFGNDPSNPLILDNMILSVRPVSRRIDLTPVFSFNEDGLWVGASEKPVDDPLMRISRWRDVIQRNQLEFAQELGTPTARTYRRLEWDGFTGG